MKREKIKEISTFSLEKETLKIAHDDLPKKVGIANRQVAIEKHGDNRIIVEKFKYVKKYLEALIEPFAILLWVISLIELIIFIFFEKEIINLISALMIIFMIFLSATIDYVQELKAYKSNYDLKQIVTNNFYVINQEIKLTENINYLTFKDQLVRINESDLTKNDLIFLTKGDIVPADCKIIWIDKNLYVNQETLTGESDPVKKHLTTQNQKLLKLDNIIYSNTVIVEGSTLAMVINTGKNKYSSLITNSNLEESETKFEESLGKITKNIIMSILASIPLILIITGLRTNDWISSTVFALSIAVALTPEALPAIISYNLKIGVKKLSKNKVIVKKMSVVQNMGSLNILTSDKTGTLTTGEFEFVELINLSKQYSNQDLEEYLYLNCLLQKNLNNKIDEAILSKLNYSNIEFKLLAEKQFDNETRFSSFLVKHNNRVVQITKGAYKEIIEMSNISQTNLIELDKQIEILTQKGFKILLLADAETKQMINNNFNIIGLIVLKDKLKDNIEKIINTFKEYDIDFKILTGDNCQNSISVLNLLKIEKIKVISGNELKKVQKLKESLNLFYEMSLLDKANVISMLQANHHTVGFLGDGVNDVLALKKADVGISVNNATPLAKANADIILLEKDLDALENSFIKGREVFTNALKFIKITVAANFGIMFTLLISSIIFTFNVMSPIELLLQNLIFDFANLIYVFDNIDKFEVAKPKQWKTNTIIRFGIFNSIPQIIISFTNFVILLFIFKLDPQNNINDLHKFQTSFFIETVITHVVVIFAYRTSLISFIKSKPSAIVFFGLIGFATIPFMLVFSIKGADFKTMTNGKENWWFLALFLLIPFGWILCEANKWIYKQIFKDWL